MGRKRNRLAPVEPNIAIDIRLACHAAMIAFRAGHANETHWNTLVYALNVALVLSGDKIVDDGLNALVTVRNTGQWKLAHHAFPIACAIDVLKQLLMTVPRVQVAAAINEVNRANNT